MIEIKLLDHGYVKYIGHMGSDETFVEAARMSTGKGFLGWYWEEDTYNDVVCISCKTQHILATLPGVHIPEPDIYEPMCTSCWRTTIVRIKEILEVAQPDTPKELTVPKLAGKKGAPRDLALLNTLYANKHATPFEMGELCIEVMAPIFVIREWFRHRSQSYNEFSGRYSQMPDLHYVPELNRMQKQSKFNNQGSGEPMDKIEAFKMRSSMKEDQAHIYKEYERYLGAGMAKELARINTPGSRYSKFRAKTDVRNWLAFLLLRMDKAAQYEIRVYAEAVAQILKQLFPRTYNLFLEHDLLGQNFSRSEMGILRRLLAGTEINKEDPDTAKVLKKVLEKLNNNKEELFKDVI